MYKPPLRKSNALAKMLASNPESPNEEPTPCKMNSKNPEHYWSRLTVPANKLSKSWPTRTDRWTN